jgi:hypothetical protein
MEISTTRGPSYFRRGRGCNNFHQNSPFVLESKPHSQAELYLPRIKRGGKC